MDMTPLKKKICVTVFLDELFEVVDEPTKKFHAQRKSIPTVTSKRRESVSKTSFSKKFSGPFDGKLRSWSENHFSNRERIKIKKSRGCKPKLPVSVKNELDKLESKANENRSKLEINKTIDSFDDDWPKEEGKISDDGEASDNFSEFCESDFESEERAKSDKSTQLSPVFEVKKIVEVTKLMESREIVQKTESGEKSEMVKVVEVPRLSEEDILRHSLCSDVVKKSFEELFRRKDSAFEKSLTSVRNESGMFDEPSQVILSDANNWHGNQEKILCYAVQVEMTCFDKITNAIPSCLIKGKKESETLELSKKGMQADDEVRNDDEVQTKVEVVNERETKTLIFDVIRRTEIGMINVLEFKSIASLAYKGLSPLPNSYEREEIVVENKTLEIDSPVLPKSDLERNESSMTVLCTISVEDLCDENDIRIVCQLDSLIADI